MELILGVILGFLSGLGIGGGSLLLLWLTLGAGMVQTEARLVNLLFFLPSALASSLLRWKQGHLNLKKLLPGMAAGAVSAFVCSFVGQRIETEWLKKGFGLLLLVTGIREVRYKPEL